MKRRRAGLAVLALLLAGAATLLAVELGLGAASFGRQELADPCTASARFPGEGLDATLQQIVLDGLNGAACELDTTRERLVLSFVPEAPGGEPIEWDRETIERAVRTGLLHAVDEARERDSIGAISAFLLREIIERAPIDWLIRGGTELAELFGT
jgi:hypothetical protein